MKTFFELQGAYKGLRVRRLKRFGRIVLDRVISARLDHPEVCGMDYDPHCQWVPVEPWWFVTIRSFDEEHDRPLLAQVGSKWGNGTFRFAHVKPALAKFAELCLIPQYVEEAKKAEISLRKNAERLRAIAQSGQEGLQKFLREKSQFAGGAGHSRSAGEVQEGSATV
jgi:hypothetical protein